MSESIRRMTQRDGAAAIAQQLREDGAVIVEDVLDPDLLRRFNEELDEVLRDVPDGRKLGHEGVEEFYGAQTQHLSGVARHSRIFVEEVLCHPLYEGVCDDLLLPSCGRYQLNVAHILDRGPGSGRQPPHRDELVWGRMSRPHPILQVASVIALQDFTRENGATLVVPGSHKWDLDRVATDSEFVPAEMKAGSAVLYLGATMHAGGANETIDRRRRGMHMSFTLGWLRTEENNYLVTPLERVRDMPRRAQELLGYATHDFALGQYNASDPIDLMERGEL